MMKTARLIARIILATPLVLVLIGVIITIIPGASDVISRLFWGLLGEIPFFGTASAILETGMTHEDLSLSYALFSFFRLLSSQILDAFTLGACVYIVKLCNFSFTAKNKVRYTMAEWKLVVIGVVIGVIVITGLNFTPAHWEAALKAILSIVLILAGIRMFFKAGGLLPSKNKEGNKTSRFIIDLLLGLFGNALSAICGVMLITCVMDGPRLIKNGGSFWVWLLWLLGCVVLIMLVGLFIRSENKAADRKYGILESIVGW